MSPVVLVILLGMAIMLGVMGVRQFRMGYRVAGTVSAVIAVALFVVVAWILTGGGTAT